MTVALDCGAAIRIFSVNCFSLRLLQSCTPRSDRSNPFGGPTRAFADHSTETHTDEHRASLAEGFCQTAADLIAFGDTLGGSRAVLADQLQVRPRQC